jgi:hypothetical protein
VIRLAGERAGHRHEQGVSGMNRNAAIAALPRYRSLNRECSSSTRLFLGGRDTACCHAKKNQSRDSFGQ